MPRLEAAAQALEPVPVTAGTVVVRQGDPADRFYVISEGAQRVTQVPDGGGPETELRTLGPVTSSARSASCAGHRGRRPSPPPPMAMLLALEADEFLELVGSGPGLSSRLLDLYRGSLSR